ncbi:CaiB/BaiF CoA transferase family protein [Thermodesulfobacteriota bacterium]
MRYGILKGLRILDFTRVLAGPYATRILADFGAEVIKIQSRKTEGETDNNIGSYYNHWNRGKRSITLDLSYREAREIVLLLTSACDVVIENFSPRVMSNWGLDYEKLKAVRSDIIMVSMSGMGQTGPWKDYVAFGSTIQSLGGLTYLTSYDRETPMGLGYSHADLISGLYGALAVLTAWEYRERTGKGQHIDVSEYEAICTSIAPIFLDILVNKQEVVPDANPSGYDEAAPYGCYQCSGEDRWCVIAVFNEKEWKALCKAMGKPRWIKDERFNSLSKRKKYKKELDQFIAQWTSTHKSEKAVQLLQNAGVAAGVVQNAEDLANDPHLSARDFFIHSEYPVSGNTISERSPIRMGRTTTVSWKRAPLLGEDNHYIFKKLLGFTDYKISSYIKRGIIG